MKLLVIYRDNSDHSRAVTDFLEMMSRKYPDKKAELLDIETRKGADTAQVYGVARYPALILMTYEGRVIQLWAGLPLPMLDEVAGQLTVD